MSARWYDQHRLTKRLRRLEQRNEAHDNMINDLMDDMLVTNPGGKIGLAFAMADEMHRRDVDAMDARERPPAFRDGAAQ